MTAEADAKHDVLIYDTTLRDGTQGEGFNLSVREKLSVAELLDELGVAYIEGGWPGSNPRDEGFFEEARRLTLRTARLAAFGSTRRAKMSCDEDPSIQALLRSETPVVTIFGKSWKFHATCALGIEPEENLALIDDTVRYLCARFDEVVFDAEHFFDGYTDDPDYALAAVVAAAEAGAHFVALCDTNGGMLTPELTQAVARVKGAISCQVGIHTHNDGELAVANSLAAVRVGATMVQGTINGCGERCGNANLISIIPALELKMGHRCLPEGSLATLTRTARTVDELTNRTPWAHQPYVGMSAFAHKGGVHVNAVMKDSRTYEHVRPELIGNRRRILISDLSGRANVVSKLDELGVELAPSDPRTRQIVERVKALENEGYEFEGAEASFRLLVDEAMGERRSFFELDHLEVSVSTALFGNEVSGAVTGASQQAVTGADGFAGWPGEARVRVVVDGVAEEATGRGNGPVNALDAALRTVVQPFYPALGEVRLVDYKVRILSSGEGTEAVVRVLIRSSDGRDQWGTVGVSTNIIEASFNALVDALEYKLVKDGVAPFRAASEGEQSFKLATGVEGAPKPQATNRELAS